MWDQRYRRYLLPGNTGYSVRASWPRTSIYDTISTSYMTTNAPSTTRARRLRERRSRGVAMCASVEVGEGGIDLLVRNELLKQHQTRDRKAVGEACLAALEQWAMGCGADCGTGLTPSDGDQDR
jgi:hypothetical protein